MKFKAALSSATLLLISNTVWADQAAYYDVEEISVDAEGANYGAYPSAISDDGTLIGSYSMKASLSRDIDIGLPFTFNRPCQYDDEICELLFSGSESSSDLSYENAYKQWRNAQSNAEDDGYSSYMMANVIDTDSSLLDSTSMDSDTGIETNTYNSTDTVVLPYEDSVDSTDVKVTDVYIYDNGTDDTADDEKIIIGYSSDAYDSFNERDFVRRAFIYNQTKDVWNSLLPDFYENDENDEDDDDYDATTDANGGFSSAYKIKKVTVDGETKILVVGTSSISLPQDNDEDYAQEYFEACYFSDEDDDVDTLNELVNCPGFDTQAWVWDVTDNLISTAVDGISGYALATEWLDDNEDNDDSDATYSASALDINASGIAVGASTFEASSSSATGGRQRAVIMTPDDNGDYDTPTELTEAVDDVGDDDGDTIYNTWAVAITDSNIVIGNREYSESKSVNKPTEFFVYDIDEDSISFPLEDLKVLTTEQRLNGDSSAKTGANSHAYDINESGFIVGKADDYDQTHAVNGGMPRTQSAFLYNNNTDESWFLNDLICTETDDVVTSPLYKIRSARVINDDGTVLAEGWKYDSDADYQDETNATEVMLKLTRNTAVTSPDDSANCWDSDLLTTEDESYERSGAAGFWLWLFALPLLLVRRFCK